LKLEPYEKSSALACIKEKLKISCRTEEEKNMPAYSSKRTVTQIFLTMNIKRYQALGHGKT